MFGLISTAILVLGAVMTFDVATNPGREILAGKANSCFGLIVVLVAVTTWLGMVPALQKNKPA